MFIMQTRNYILKCVNSLVLLPKWHVIKTKHTCRYGESGIGRTSGSWKFPEPISLWSVSSGNFQPPSVRPIPDSPPNLVPRASRELKAATKPCILVHRPKLGLPSQLPWFRLLSCSGIPTQRLGRTAYVLLLKNMATAMNAKKAYYKKQYILHLQKQIILKLS